MTDEKTRTEVNQKNMMTWRLLNLEVNDAFTNMAIDEAIVQARIKGLVSNTLRFYQWKPSAVSIGRFQDVSNEVQIDNCRRLGIDIVRRISGGGTVYHDVEGEITYSIIAQEEIFGTKDVVQAYNAICKGLIEAAKILGVNADFNSGDPKNCPNIAINGKKISGSSQFHQGGVMLQHGTFLLDTDLDRMFTLLRVPRKRLTSIKQEIGKTVPTEEAYQALIKGFEKGIQKKLREGELTTYEQKLAQELRRDKFSTDEWNFKGKSKSEA